MPHAKEHPLAGRRVVPDERTGEEVRIVEWIDRVPGGSALLWPSHPAARAFLGHLAEFGLHASGAVLARASDGLRLIHHAELPSYDPEPVGVIS